MIGSSRRDGTRVGPFMCARFARSLRELAVNSEREEHSVHGLLKVGVTDSIFVTEKSPKEYIFFSSVTTNFTEFITLQRDAGEKSNILMESVFVDSNTQFSFTVFVVNGVCHLC